MKNLLITTKRLAMRHMSIADAAFILEQYNEPLFIEHIGDKNIRSVEDAINRIIDEAQSSYRKYGIGLLMVELRDCGTPIGTCGLLKRDGIEELDIGYALLERHHRQGYVIEAAQAVLGYAKNELGFNRVLGYTSSLNKVSIRILEKLGFEDEGEFNYPGYNGESKVFSISLQQQVVVNV
jgi:RimJ/RimL family protein N-acetyltransferase